MAFIARRRLFQKLLIDVGEVLKCLKHKRFVNLLAIDSRVLWGLVPFAAGGWLLGSFEVGDLGARRVALFTGMVYLLVFDAILGEGHIGDTYMCWWSGVWFWRRCVVRNPHLVDSLAGLRFVYVVEYLCDKNW